MAEILPASEGSEAVSDRKKDHKKHCLLVLLSPGTNTRNKHDEIIVSNSPKKKRTEKKKYVRGKKKKRTHSWLGFMVRLQESLILQG